ncbi:hypothetical protein J6590_065090 [Homalodisca vitripennis]|nr:hypothetical protein J6590_065090 [Homalodisca vitripennis]
MDQLMANIQPHCTTYLTTRPLCRKNNPNNPNDQLMANIQPYISSTLLVSRDTESRPETAEQQGGRQSVSIMDQLMANIQTPLYYISSTTRPLLDRDTESRPEPADQQGGWQVCINNGSADGKYPSPIVLHIFYYPSITSVRREIRRAGLRQQISREAGSLYQ